MNDREKVIKEAEQTLSYVLPDEKDTSGIMVRVGWIRDILALLKEQDELLKHEYWRGYNNGRADERGLQEGTIMQTFSPD